MTTYFTSFCRTMVLKNEVCFLNNNKHFILFDISNASNFVTDFIRLIKADILMIIWRWLLWVFIFKIFLYRLAWIFIFIIFLWTSFPLDSMNFKKTWHIVFPCFFKDAIAKIMILENVIFCEMTLFYFYFRP